VCEMYVCVCEMCVCVCATEMIATSLQLLYFSSWREAECVAPQAAVMEKSRRASPVVHVEPWKTL